MPIETLRQFLESNQVKYVTLTHSPAYTAQEAAAEAHIPGREVAKTVMVRLDDELAMVVLPAPYKVDLDRLRKAAGASAARLAGEDDFRDRFPNCELGAMPPFGNLWGMNVFADRRLREDERIAFHAGSHSELVKLSYEDFERLVQPVIVEVGVREAAA